MSDKKTEQKEPKEGIKSSPTRLFRSETDKILAGVCGGLGEYFRVDSTIIRIIFILLAVGGGSGILIYLILWLVMPNKSSKERNSNELIRENMDDMKQRAKHFAESVTGNVSDPAHSDSRTMWGVFVILAGIVFLLNNYGFISIIELRKLWPFLLIIFGYLILTRKN